MRNSNLFSVFLDAVNIASVAIIISVCYFMGKESIVNKETILIAVISAIVTFGLPRVNSVVIILASSILGYILTLI